MCALTWHAFLSCFDYAQTCTSTPWCWYTLLCTYKQLRCAGAELSSSAQGIEREASHLSTPLFNQQDQAWAFLSPFGRSPSQSIAMISWLVFQVLHRPLSGTQRCLILRMLGLLGYVELTELHCFICLSKQYFLSSPSRIKGSRWPRDITGILVISTDGTNDAGNARMHTTSLQETRALPRALCDAIQDHTQEIQYTTSQWDRNLSGQCGIKLNGSSRSPQFWESPFLLSRLSNTIPMQFRHEWHRAPFP